MKVLNAKVQWNLNWGNSPQLEVLVDEIPKNLLFTQKKSLFYGENKGYVEFYHWTAPDNNQGYGGSHIPITIINGEVVILKGPWSSRAGVMNFNNFGPCVEVSLTDDEVDYKRGYTFMSGAITLDLAVEALSKYCPRITLYEEQDDTDITYIPTLFGKTPNQTKFYLRDNKELFTKTT